MYTQPARILINHEEKRSLMRMHTNILAAYLFSLRHLSNIGRIETQHTTQTQHNTNDNQIKRIYLEHYSSHNGKARERIKRE